MAVDAVILRKIQIIEKCIIRIKEECGSDLDNIEKLSQVKQDSVLLNLERACQAAIDLAMRIVKKNKLGLPTESREAFELLFKSGLIASNVNKNMVAMVGFRNTAIHDYQGLNLKIVASIVANNLKDFLEFTSVALKI